MAIVGTAGSSGRRHDEHAAPPPAEHAGQEPSRQRHERAAIELDLKADLLEILVDEAALGWRKNGNSTPSASLTSSPRSTVRSAAFASPSASRAIASSRHT